MNCCEYCGLDDKYTDVYYTIEIACYSTINGEEYLCGSCLDERDSDEHDD